MAGRVTDASSDSGVSGATVTIVEGGRGAMPSRQVPKSDTTDADGWYEIQDVQPGKASMTINMPQASIYESMQLEIEVPGDRPTASVWLKLVRKDGTQPTGVTLSPENASVVLGSTLQFSAQVAPASSGVSAFFSVQGDVGTINAEGLFTGTKLGTGIIAAQAGTVRTTTQVTVTAPPPTKGSITGLVKDAAQRGVSGATVTADSASTTTATDGSYTLSDLTAGTYTVGVTANGFAAASHSVEVVAGQVATADFTLQSGIRVTVDPSSVTLRPDATQTFTATVTGTTSNNGVNWSVQEGASGGSIDASGNYTAPTARGTYHVVATSKADANQQDSATVTVESGTVTATVE